VKNAERQAVLDRKKWLESREQGFDMSGCMLYCSKCEFADHSHPTENGKCYAPHEKRVSECLCAKAYNRFAR
jgi:hypothetical protein